MICGDCRTAGSMNQAANQETERTDIRDRLQIAAHEWHAKCRGNTWCDCQHVIGEVIKPEWMR